MNINHTEYGPVRSVEELGQLARFHRKRQKHTLMAVSEIGNFSTRFLSEFERGKETAEIGKVMKALGTIGLEVVIRPRSYLSVEPVLPEQEPSNV